MTPEEMVKGQLIRRGIKDARVLEAMRKVPRHLFVPENLMDQAYEDGPLPIGLDQTISQPYIVAYMTEELEIKSEDRILEIGTGSGYQSAILAEVAKEVFTVEILEPLHRSAKNLLEGMGYQNIHFRRGDGSQGWPEEAPFDKIMVTAAAEGQIPKNLVQQLNEGGMIMIPVGHFSQNLILGVKQHGHIQTIEKIPVRFVPLVETEEKI